jgi:hypothetical protein
MNFHSVPNQVLGAAVFAKQIEPGYNEAALRVTSGPDLVM